MTRTGKVQLLPSGKRLILPSGKAGVMINEDDCCPCDNCCATIDAPSTVVVTGWSGDLAFLNGTHALDFDNFSGSCIASHVYAPGGSGTYVGTYGGTDLYFRSRQLALTLYHDLSGVYDVAAIHIWRFRHGSNDYQLGGSYQISDSPPGVDASMSPDTPGCSWDYELTSTWDDLPTVSPPPVAIAGPWTVVSQFS